MAVGKSDQSFALNILKDEFKKIMKEGTYDLSLVEDDYFHWEILVPGPAETLYDGVALKASLKFPPEFPSLPPEMKFHDDLFHPNIYPDGRVCISILHPPGTDAMNEQETADERWRPIFTVESIVVSVTSLLGEANTDSPANVDAAKMMREEPDKYRRTVLRLVRKISERE